MPKIMGVIKVNVCSRAPFLRYLRKYKWIFTGSNQKYVVLKKAYKMSFFGVLSVKKIKWAKDHFDPPEFFTLVNFRPPNNS